MKGFVPTPCSTVDSMVDRLFKDRQPRPKDTVLDPGCGTGSFIDGIIRWCEARARPLPRIIGIESDARHLPALRQKYRQRSTVDIRHTDFLVQTDTVYDFVVGNPPYVAITSLSDDEKLRYRARYATARGRFDLYLLFFEQALRNLAPGGRLAFITPEKYLYVETAGPLRQLLAERYVEEIRLVSEATFGALVTYPTITVVRNAPREKTKVVLRDGRTLAVELPSGSDPWFPLFEKTIPREGKNTIGDLCLRISCGVATGADGVFVRPADRVDAGLRRFAHPTIAGRQLTPATTDLPQQHMMLIPYDADARLLPLERLGRFAGYLMREDVREKLLGRTCVKRKPWYAFHETPMLHDILRPKILCKDICETSQFWIDRAGTIVPRHSVYYLVPRNPAAIDLIATYLNSSPARQWLARNCQRASKGFLRLQSRTLRKLPVPDSVMQASITLDLENRTTRPQHQSELALAG